MYVYCPEVVWTESQVHGKQHEMSNLIQRIENEGIPALELLFEVLYPYWKRPLDNFRLIGSLKFVGVEPVLCFVSLISWGSQEYRTFLDRKEDPGFQEQFERRLPSLNELEEWIIQRNQQEVHRKPPLPNYLHGWLQCFGRWDVQDTLIIESQSWTQQLTHNSTDEERRRYCQIVLDWLDPSNHQGYRSRQIAPNIELFSATDGLSILVSQVTLLECSQQSTFLLGAFPQPPTSDELEKLGQELALFGNKAPANILAKTLSLETINRYARRAYPQDFLCDEKLWLEIESHLEGNLALSPEEQNILRQAMPLFINGRAGSGKSMMLYYRFVDCCYLYINTLHHHTNKELRDYRPLFLTYSSSLAEQARAKVHNLLKINYHSLLSRRLTAADLDEIDQCFSTFQNVVLNCLPEDDQLIYAPSTYINFHRFKAHYHHSFAHSSMSAEIAWHIIRTYIKGYELTGSDSGYLDIEDYLQEVPLRDRSVSKDDFQYVHNCVWPWYQQLCRSNHFWDDQDLVRAALTSDNLQPTYTAIFCDEVQDFTRLELKLILHISIWKHFELPQVVRSLPFAFAGDPMQTINPTGFRWKNLTANFFEQIVSTFNPTQRSLRQLDPYDLQNNYRSDNSITLFSNIIHLWRRSLFGLTELKPQKPWRPQELGCPPQHLTFSDNLTIEDIKTIIQCGMILILPCDEGGELDFIKNDSHLKPLLEKFLQEGKKPENIQTPASVKGMEFQKVIIYKFGDYYIHHFRKPLHTLERNSDSLELMYFLSKLYVALSRPLKVLGILESRVGKESFWDHACQLELWLEGLGQHQSEWEPLLGHAVSAHRLDAFTQIDASQYSQIAIQFLQEGWEKGSESNLWDAESYAKRARDELLEQECRAWRLRLMRQFREAGQIFLKLAETGSELQNSRLTPAQEAWHCFWEGQHWNNLQHWYHTYEEKEPNHQPIVEFMVRCANEKTIEQGQLELSLILDYLPAITNWIDQAYKHYPQVLNGYRRDPSWQAFAKTYLACVEALWLELDSETIDSEKLPEALFPAITSSLLRLDASHNSPRHDPKQCKRLAARGLYWQSQYSEAVQLWDGIAETEHSLYYRARIELDNYPEKVKWLSKENRHREVVDAWLETKAITGKWSKYLETVAGSLQIVAEYDHLLELRIRQQSWDKFWQIPLEFIEAHWTIKHDHLFIEELAKDKNSLPRKQREFFESVLQRAIKDQPWKPKLSIYSVGIALEKQGNFRDSLSFFENFIDNPEPQIRDYARCRWLVVKGKQATSAKDPEKADKNRSQQQNKAEEWGVDLNTLEEEIPTLTFSGQLSKMRKDEGASLILSNEKTLGFGDVEIRDEIQSILASLSYEDLLHARTYLSRLRRQSKLKAAG
jgi:hypothetical protein